MNAHALSVLEFHRVLDVVAGFAVSPLGAERVRALRPTSDVDWITRELTRVAACRSLMTADERWSPDTAPDVRGALSRLRVAGAGLGGAELVALAGLLSASRRTRESLADTRRPAVALAVLAPLRDRLIEAQAVEHALERALQPDGTLRDGASAALRRIRRELQGAHGELVALLERALARLDSQYQVPDMSVTVRNGRYVIPVRREGARAVGGIVHDTSATGATVFVEPPAAVEFGNRIRELEAEELREIERILLELTSLVHPHAGALADAQDALTELDALSGRARFALRYGCNDVTLADPNTGFALFSARHPLLLAQGVGVVPFSLEMDAHERTLLVSGPNTGGKTVLLKAVGLISLLVQSGVPVPVAAESRVPVYDDVFADIGDEQSIEASLSTFSAHVRNLGEILRAATARSLALVDELGSGTDPLEGAALGGAILEELTRRGTRTVATTHLGALKELAADVPGVVNASLQFDEERLAPTYRLIKGVPGRSYGISIARRLELPSEIVARAEQRLPTAERDYTALLAELERRQAEMDARAEELSAMSEDAQARAARLAEREKNVRAREREAERASRREARQLVLDARAEVERTLKALLRADAAERDEAARDARRRLEAVAANQAQQLERLDREEARLQQRQPRGPAGESDVPAAGDAVEVTTLGNRIGQLLEVRDAEGVVAIGGIKLTLPLARLRRTERRREETVVLRGEAPEVEAATEIDLRGLRVEEVDGAVLQAIDAAVRADLRQMRIIHGKGTGALRQRVTEMLRKDTRVREFRLGAWNEGGAGVTVVLL